MQLEEYLEFRSDNEIVLKGTRVGLEVLVREYLAGQLPEQIVLEYPSVSLEQTYAVVAYYLRNRAAVDAYCARVRAWSRSVRRAESTPTPVVERLRDLRRRVSAA